MYNLSALTMNMSSHVGVHLYYQIHSHLRALHSDFPMLYRPLYEGLDGGIYQL